MSRAFLVAAVVACSCSSPPRGPVAPAPAVAPAAAPVAAIDPHATTVDHLAGVWVGKAIGTPYGDFPMAIEFAPVAGGAVHGHLEAAPGNYLDFTFDHDKLVEEGAVPSLGVQTHTLRPAGPDHWRDDTVDVDLRITGDALVWTTSVRGKTHSRFELARKTGDEAIAVRQAIARRNQSR